MVLATTDRAKTKMAKIGFGHNWICQNRSPARPTACCARTAFGQRSAGGRGPRMIWTHPPGTGIHPLRGTTRRLTRAQRKKTTQTDGPRESTGRLENEWLEPKWPGPKWEHVVSRVIVACSRLLVGIPDLVADSSSAEGPLMCPSSTSSSSDFFLGRDEEKSVNSQPHKKKASYAWSRSSRTTSCTEGYSALTPGNGRFSKGDGKSSCRGASEDSFPPHHPGSCCLRPEELGCWHGPMPPRTVLSLPTTCRRFHQSRPPTGISQTDAAPGLAEPSRLKGDTSVVSTASWDPLNKLSPSTTVSGRLGSPTPTDGTSMSLTTTLVDTLPPCTLGLRLCRLEILVLPAPQLPRTLHDDGHGSYVDGHIGNDGKKRAEGSEVFGRATPGKAEDRSGSPDWCGKR